MTPASRTVFLLAMFLAATASSQTSWEHAGISTGVRVIHATSADNIYAAATDTFFVSAHGGVSWSPVSFADSSLDDFFTFIITPDSAIIYFAAEPGVYRLTSIDQDPVMLDSTLTGTYSLAIDSSGRLFATGSEGVFRSTDRGDSWQYLHPAMGNLSDAILCTPAGVVLVSSIDGLLLRSSDGGAVWDTVGPIPESLDHILAMTVSPVTGTLLAAYSVVRNEGARGPIYRSTDAGVSWTLVDSSAQLIDVLYSDANGVCYAGGSVLWRSVDDGVTWQPFDDGLPPGFAVHSFLRTGDLLLAGTDGGIYKRGYVATHVHGGEPMPLRSVLLDVYPNPFNPATEIRYQTPDAGHVRLSVFDMRGREVALLVDTDQADGVYSIRWSATGLASGTYLCRLQSGDSMVTSRLVLLR